MSVESLVSNMARLCGARNAERWDAINSLVFRTEMRRKDSPFARNAQDDDHPENRLETAFAFSAADPYKKRYCHDLLLLCMLRHYEKEHGIKRWSAKAEVLEDILRLDERNHPDVAEILSVKAASSGVWA